MQLPLNAATIALAGLGARQPTLVPLRLAPLS